MWNSSGSDASLVGSLQHGTEGDRIAPRAPPHRDAPPSASLVGRGAAESGGGRSRARPPRKTTVLGPQRLWQH